MPVADQPSQNKKMSSPKWRNTRSSVVYASFPNFIRRYTDVPASSSSLHQVFLPNIRLFLILQSSSTRDNKGFVVIQLDKANANLEFTSALSGSILEKCARHTLLWKCSLSVAYAFAKSFTAVVLYEYRE